MKKHVTILILLFVVHAAIGQDSPDVNKLQDYEIKLKEAENLFTDGHYDKCIADLEWILKSCRLSKNEKENVLQLLAKADLEIGQPGQADSALDALLKNNPHYQLNEDIEPEQYSRMIKKYKIHPLLSIGARNTLDFMHLVTTKTYSALPGLNYKTPYSSTYGLLYYGTMEYEFNKHWALTGDLIFFWMAYDRYIGNIYFYEKDHFAELPLYVKKYFPVGKNILPYVASGLGWTILYKADAYVARDSLSDNFNILNMRNQNILELIFGAGIGYQFRNLRLFLDVRYYPGLTSLTNASARYNNPILINDFYYIDNTIKLNQFEFGATISYTLINSVRK